MISQLGLTQLVRSEEELMSEAEERGGGPVPEEIWRMDDTLLSVEVKRISGNTLPVQNNPDGRRRILRRGKIVWPWQLTVHCAVQKASSPPVVWYKVHVHYAVVLIPDTMSSSEQERTCRHIRDAAASAMRRGGSEGAKVKVMVMRGRSFPIPGSR